MACGAPFLWVSRKGRIYELMNRLEEEQLDPATELAIREQLEALSKPDVDEGDDHQTTTHFRNAALGPVATQIREGLVFGRSNGDAFIPSNVRARALTAWRKASEAEAKRAEAEEREPNLLQPIGLHECRYTYASFCIAAGVNAKALTEYMGHSSITVSFDLYGHLMPGNEAEAAGLLDGYLDRATKLSAVFGKGERA